MAKAEREIIVALRNSLAEANKELEEKNKQIEVMFSDHAKDRMDLRMKAEAAEKRADDAEAKYNDLKLRVYNAEKSNEFMRGYIARVGEDDVVREELVTVGDPHGEQRLVPKRKRTEFPRPSDYGYDGEKQEGGRMNFRHNADGGWRHEPAPRPKHWIEY